MIPTPDGLHVYSIIKIALKGSILFSVSDPDSRGLVDLIRIIRNPDPDPGGPKQNENQKEEKKFILYKLAGHE
jgi:hypothetical protein